MGCVKYYRRGRSDAEPACRQVSRAKRSAKIKMCSSRLRCRSAAGSSASPFCGCPATLCEACGLRRLWRSPRLRGASLKLTKRGEGRTAYGTESSGRSASERMFAECAEPKRSGVEKPWCRSRATSCEAVRSAPCSWAQCAFERSGVLRCWFSERSLASAKMIWTPPGAGDILSDVQPARAEGSVLRAKRVPPVTAASLSRVIAIPALYEAPGGYR